MDLFTGITGLLTAVKMIGDNAAYDSNGAPMDNAARGVLNISNSGDIMDIVKPSIIEPYVYIDSKLRGHEQLQNAINTELDVFVAIYSVAMQKLVNKYGDVDVAVQALSTHEVGPTRALGMVSTEACSVAGIAEATCLPLTFTPEEKTEEVKTGFKMESENVGLQVRKVNISLTGNIDGKSVTINLPLILMARIRFVNMIDYAENVLTSKSRNFLDRTDMLLAKEISFGEWLTGSDIVKDRIKRYLREKNGIIGDLSAAERRDLNKVFTEYGIHGMTKYFHILIMHRDTARLLSKTLHKNIMAQDGKAELMEKGQLLSFLVLDDDYSMATLAIRKIRGVSELSYKDLVKKQVKEGEGIGDLLKYVMNSRV